MKTSHASLSFTLLAACFAACFVAAINIPGKIVKTDSGPVEGILLRSRLRREYYAWLGIPYAKPPVGKLRFAPPQPYGKWQGLLQAAYYGSRCAQFDAIQDFTAGREDCLFLNIFSPREITENANRRRFPVMVFFHGGGFVFGTTNDYRATYFMDEDVILVLVNYRLGALGFLNTGDDEVRGNMGLKDQSLALRWVHDNIASFGGDNARITIFGESAGGSSVHYHMISPMSRGLFYRAISQSGVATSLFAFNEDPVGQAKSFAKELGCPSYNGKAIAKCLRAKPLREILDYQQRTTSIWYHPEQRISQHLFRATIETVKDQNTFLGEHPEKSLEEGNFSKVPWLTGVNSAEGLVWMHPFFTNESFRQALQNDWETYSVYELLLKPEERHASKAIRKFYLSNANLSSFNSLSKYQRLLSDRWFYVPMHKMLNIHVAQAPTYAYYYSKMGPSPADLYHSVVGRFSKLTEIIMARFQDWFMSDLLRMPRPKYGAAHTDECLMLFPYFPVYNIRPENSLFTFSRDIVRLWADFASGNKTTLQFRNVTFPLYEPGDDPYYFEINDNPRLVQLHLKKRVDFWDSISNEIR